MALATGTLFEVRASATTGNVNGAGFNIAAAFPTDYTASSANTSAPVLSSATYSFVAGDVGAWVYVAAGTNWIPGFYQIASVGGGSATLSAAIGAGLVFSTTYGVWIDSTVVGVASVASPTGGTVGVDYSQQDTAVVNGVADFAAVGASTTLTSATAGFTAAMVGNFFHQTTTGTGAFGVVGWYEIVTFTNSTTVVLDRTPNSGTASVACTGYVGGAGRLNGLEDAFCEMVPAGARIFVKSGTYTASGNVSVASTAATQANPITYVGYTSKRGDTCNSTNRPLLAVAGNTLALGTFRFLRNFQVTTNSNAGMTLNAAGVCINCYVFNSSSTAGRIATSTTSTACIQDSEIIAQNGTAINNAVGSNPGRVVGCYVHDSTNGLNTASATYILQNNVFAACSTASAMFSTANAVSQISDNTFYGSEAKIGVGLNFTGANSAVNVVYNNIFYGLTTGVAVDTGHGANIPSRNNFYNNTTDTTNWYKNRNDLALDPQFVSASQITGSTATTSGSVLTQSGGNFSSVVDGKSFVRVFSGTGVTVANYAVISHTSTTLTVNNALGTSVAGDVVYSVTVNTNFTPGANMSGVGTPSFSDVGAGFTSYPDVGAVQRQPGGANNAAWIRAL